MSPLKNELILSFAEQNTMKILDMSKLLLNDEQGEQWAGIKNHIGHMRQISESKYALYFESNYSRIPEQITINFTDIMVVPKSESYVEVDFQRREMLSELPSMKKIVEVTSDKSVRTKYDPSVDKVESALGRLIDANGEIFYVASFSFSEENGDLYFKLNYGLSDTTEQIASPVKIEINYTEIYLEETVNLHIDLDNFQE